MATKTYDFKKVTLILGGHIASGFADGTGITVELDEDRWIKQTGSDGEFTRSKQNNKAGAITLTLQHSSATNDILSGLLVLDEATGAGLFPVLIKDNNGTTVAAAPKAFVMATPSVEFGREAADREWVIGTGELEMFVGGLS